MDFAEQLIDGFPLDIQRLGIYNNDYIIRCLVVFVTFFLPDCLGWVGLMLWTISTRDSHQYGGGVEYGQNGNVPSCSQLQSNLHNPLTINILASSPVH